MFNSNSKSGAVNEAVLGAFSVVDKINTARGNKVEKWADGIGRDETRGVRGNNLVGQTVTGEELDQGEVQQGNDTDTDSNNLGNEENQVLESEAEVDDEDESVEIRRKIRLLGWNAEGLFEKLGLNGVSEYINSFDIACLGETFTYSSFDFSIKFGDFIALHSPAKKFNFRGRPSGGLVVLVRKSLERFITIIDTKISHIICFKIAKELLNSAKDILFLGTYVHPSDSVFYTDEDHECTLEAMEQFLLDQMEEGDDNDYLIVGDLNARVSDWSIRTGNIEDEDDERETIERTAQDSIINENGQKLIQTCIAFSMTPVNGLKQKNFDDKLTFIGRRGCSTIDHFVCSLDLLDKVDTYKTGDRIESQHLPIEMELVDSNNQLQNNNALTEERREITKVRWKETKREECINILNKPSTQRGFDAAVAALEESVDAGLEQFDKTMQEINKPMKNNIKINKEFEPKKKWFDKECESKKKEARQALVKMNKINARNKKDEYKRAKENYLDKRIQYQKIIREKRKQYKKDMQEKLINNRNDPKAFWNEIRKLSYRKQKQANISIQEWGDHFEQVFNPDGSQEAAREVEELNRADPIHAGEDIQQEIVAERELEEEIIDIDEEISREEIIGGIDKLKKGKASGTDDFSAELIQTAKGKIIEFLYKLFNKMYNTGCFPLQWATAIVVPLHKKGDINNPDHYRGISLLSITSKIFTGILNRRLYEWAEDNDKINVEQAGFRKSHSTIDHIYTLHSMISNCLYGRRRSKFYVCFVDFKKAFDTVRRDRLWEVLNRQGVTNKMTNMLKAIYNKVTAVIRYGNELSNEINCPLGVRQGCQLSPLLFTLLISELAQGIARDGMHGYQFNPGFIEIFTLLFADDIALTATTPRGLQNQIDLLKRGAERLGLVVNLDKTKVMVFRKGGYLGRLEKWFFGEERIEVVNKYKYLGYTLTTKLSVDLALSEQAGKAKGRIVNIFRALYRLGSIDLSIFFKLFDSQVKPILLYGAEIWGIKQRDIVEKVQLFACKKLLGVSAKTPNSFIYFEMNRYPLYVDARVKVLKYWAKLLNLEEGRLPKQAYNRELREDNKVDGWGKLLKEHLTVNGFGYIWESQEGGLVNSSIREFRQREIDNFWQNEHRGMEESRSRRFVNYLTFKEDHEREDYLGSIKIPKFRRALTRLRFGVDELKDNRKYTNPQASRQCPFCITEETAFHFLLECPTYHDLRIKYIKKYWITLNGLTLKDLVNNQNPDITQGTAAFIYYGLLQRNRQ